jgi:hypothetical protein
MGIPLSSLSDKLGVNVAATDIFLISNLDSTQDNKITNDEFSKSFTGLYAQNSQGFTIFESNGVYGLSISGSNGFVGINDRTPFVSLDVVDNLASTNGSGQIRLSTLNSGRKIAFSLSDPNTYYEFSKKPNDTKLYLESSVNGGSTFTNLFVVDQSGNFGITNSTGNLTDKFLISGESIQFQNSGNAILFDPYNTEIKTSATDETLFLNYNNIADINIGKNGVFVKNNISTPYVGIGHSSPNAVLHASGVGQVAKLQSSSTTVSQCFKHSTSDAFIGLNSNKFYFGPSNGLSSYNIVYNMAGDGTFGLGTANPVYKLDLLSTGPTEYTVAHFETTGAKTCEVVIGSNKVLGGADTGPRNSFLTFSRYDGTTDIDKWSIGNIKTDTTFGGNDDFVFITNGYFGASPNVVAKLSTAGSLDIDGSYTTNDGYCKGKFIQTYQTRVTGFDIYFSPIAPNSDIIPSGNNSIHAPFTVTPYNGTIERIALFTSDTNALASAYRFEICVITPTYNPSTPTQFVTGFFVSPPSDPVSYPTSGIIGATYFDGINPNVIQIKNKSNISGSTAFSSGRLIQYRLCEPNGAKSVAVDFTITSTIAYTIN